MGLNQGLSSHEGQVHRSAFIVTVFHPQFYASFYAWDRFVEYGMSSCGRTGELKVKIGLGMK
jgi:hypothetical protein